MLALDIYFSVFTFTVAHAHPVSNPSFDIFFFLRKNLCTFLMLVFEHRSLSHSDATSKNCRKNLQNNQCILPLC